MKAENLVRTQNPHLEKIDEDFLYHFGLNSNQNLKEKFGDVKVVCMGGSEGRIKRFAEMSFDALKDSLNLDPSCAEVNIAESAGRYVMYKIGPILTLNHGMGMPSLSIALHEVVKLLFYAGASNVEFIRLGTCGGVGVPAGTLCITRRGYTQKVEPYYPVTSLGKTSNFSSEACSELSLKLVQTAQDLGLNCRIGNTIGTDDFYEAQGRLDGSFCSIEEADKLAWLKELSVDHDIINFEMEAPLFLAFCRRAGIPSAIMCCAMLNRFEGDQINTPKEILCKFIDNVLEVAIAYVKRRIHEDKFNKKLNQHVY